MSSVNDTTTGRAYWRSLDDLADTPEFREFVHNEFPSSATELVTDADRRQFLKIMGASLALAGMGLTGCRRWPEEYIAPYAQRPVDRIPGVPEYYATSYERGGVAYSLLATSHEGRPTKVDGNPDHPIAQGASDAYAQASVLDLYDPDRSRLVLRNGEVSNADTFAAWCADQAPRFRQASGAGLAVLSEASSSPTIMAIRARLSQSCQQMTWAEYEAINNDDEMTASRRAFAGNAYRPRVNLHDADVIVSFGDDVLDNHPDSMEMVRGFAKNRRAMDPDHPNDTSHAKKMNRLYVFESGLSLTGANADERHALRGAQLAAAITWLAAKLAPNDAMSSSAIATAESVLADDVKATLGHAFEDLQAAQGRSVVLVGRGVPVPMMALAHMMNERLGNVGSTIVYRPLPPALATDHVGSLRDLVSRMNTGQVDTLVLLGGNPSYTAPIDIGFNEALKNVRRVVHVSDYVDETYLAREANAPSDRDDWHVNRAHYLECWGDGLSADGTYTLQQPLIQPLFNGKSTLEVLAMLAGDEMTAGQDLVRRTYTEMAGESDDKAWRSVLHDGFVSDLTPQTDIPSVQSGAVREALTTFVSSVQGNPDSFDDNGWEVIFALDGKMYDGRYANNGWMQEVPQTISKLTWDNAALMSVASAKELDVDNSDLITVTIGDRSVELPVLIIPGMAAKTIELPLGYGRTFPGRICTGSGRNTYVVRSATGMWRASANVSRSQGTYALATTQDHHAIDVEGAGGKGAQRRIGMLVREGSLDEYKRDPKFAKHRAHVVHRLSLWDDNHGIKDAKHAWAMAIDLSACIGCSACVVACQAENNIAIVGKDQVMRGREMHWLRIDRYYRFGKDENGDWDANKLEVVALQPVSCMHCENAPCEQVCPVAATVHDEEGLNVMVYNRCIGTRYCSNNCPYKVRRFNYFDYHRRDAHREQPGTLLQVDPTYYTDKQADPGVLKSMQFNPEVTVRMRGVMEKCTYCVQRIQKAKIDAKNAWTKESEDAKRTTDRIPIPDGTIKTACGQACSADAIVFGDLNDPDSRVAKLHKHDRAYEMLEELNVNARTKYLARLRNPVDGKSIDEGHGHGHGEHDDHGDHDHGDDHGEGHGHA
ncbi:MAG: TAT-variant-translocated molybdopterin oxidoreductase [Planctomycetota bacterium]